MATFVLVHGAFIGGWAWRRLTPLLTAAGHDVWTPTLTGAGERAHLLTPGIGLSTNIQDIVSVLEYEDLRDVILVGHSYGGMVITGVADRARERIAELVYLDAHVPENGQNAMGALTEGTSEKLEDMSGGPAADEQGPRLLPALSPELLGIVEPEQQAWVAPRLRAHAMKCLEEPLFLEHGEPAMPRSYVLCTDRQKLVDFFKVDPLSTFVDKARRDGFRFHEIPSGHTPMISHPRELAAIFSAIAAAPAR